MMKSIILLCMALSFSVAYAQIDPKAASICKQYSYLDQQQACFGKIKDHDFNDNAVNLCGQYSYIDQKVNCLLDLADKSFSAVATTVCMQYSYLDQKKNCMVKLAGKDFDPQAASVCVQYSYLDQKVDCLEKIGTVTIVSSQVSGLVLPKLYEALSELKAGHSARTQQILGGLVRTLESDPAVCQ